MQFGMKQIDAIIEKIYKFELIIEERRINEI